MLGSCRVPVEGRQSEIEQHEKREVAHWLPGALGWLREANDMLMIICGAGASYDSIPHIGEDAPGIAKMPLGDHLFSARDDFRQIVEPLEQLWPLIPKLADPAEGDTVESRLAKFQAEVTVVPHRKGQLLAARFYLREAVFTAQRKWLPLARNVTNYVALLDEVKSYAGPGPHPIVTFNYDTLLEHAIRATTGRGMEPDQATSSAFPLYKLHGSVDWGHRVSGPHVPPDADGAPLVNYLCSNTSSISVCEDIEQTPFNPPCARNGERVYVPAIALPVSSKGEFECPPPLVNDLRSKLPQVGRIVSIGWKAGEDAFIEMLSETLPQAGKWLTVGVDRAEGRELARRISQRIPNWDFVPASGKFSNLVRGDELKRFLQGKDPFGAR